MLALLRSDDGGGVPPHCSLLLRTLCSMARHEGPYAFFDFADAGAGIVRNAALRCALHRFWDKGPRRCTWNAS